MSHCDISRQSHFLNPTCDHGLLKATWQKLNLLHESQASERPCDCSKTFHTEAVRDYIKNLESQNTCFGAKKWPW